MPRHVREGGRGIRVAALVLAVIAALASLPAVSEAAGTWTNVLPNASFETDADGDSVPDGWIVQTSGTAFAGLVDDSSQHGRKALRIVDPSPLATFSLRSPPVPVTPGHEVRATLWIRDDSRPNPPLTATLPPGVPDPQLAGQPAFELRFLTAAGSTIEVLGMDWVNLTRGWNQAVIVAPAPHDATQARVYLRGALEHVRVWTIDNATIETGGVETGTLVANGNLDAGRPPRMPFAWQAACTGGATATHEEVSFQRGHVRLQAPSGRCELLSHEIPAGPRACYELAGSVRGEGGAEWGIRFYAADDLALSEPVWYSLAEDLALSGTVCAPGDAAFGRFFVRTADGTGSDLVVDDLFVIRRA